MITREEWQESSPTPIDSIMEAEGDLHDRDELIRLLGQIVYHQQKLIRHICKEDGKPRVVYSKSAGTRWRYDVGAYVAYTELQDDLLPRLPRDWIETLEV